MQAARYAGSSVNGHRSALCGFYGTLLQLSNLAEHPLLAGVVASAKIAIPTKPRYDDTWDASLIPRYWSRTPANSLVLMRAKAISLSILALFARPSDLARISAVPAHFVLSPTGYKFKIRGAKESKSASKLTPFIALPFFTAEEEDNVLGYSCCPAAAWRAYFDALHDTNPTLLPPGAQVYPTGRFLSLTTQKFTNHDGSISGKFHTPIGAERISKVMKEVMEAAGVDVSKYGGGSGRHAGSSAAFDRGVEMESILARGRWSSFETFRKFYLRSRITAAQREARM